MARSAPHLTELLVFRVSPEDKTRIRGRALVCGLTLSAYLRAVALGTIPRARPNQLELQVLYHLVKIGTNLNQLTRAAHQRRAYVLTQRLEQTLGAIEGAIRELRR